MSVQKLAIANSTEFCDRDSVWSGLFGPHT
jgi:hypothetical protein